MSGFSLDKSPHSKPHFEGLEALITKERLAAHGLTVARQRRHLLPNGKIIFQSFFISTTVQPLAGAAMTR